VTKVRLQFLIAAMICVLWGIGVISAVYDGKDLLKATTGPFGVVIGWAFTSKATNGKEA